MGEGERDVCSEGKSCKTACINKNWVCRMEFIPTVDKEIPKLTGLISGLSQGNANPIVTKGEPPTESVEAANKAADLILSPHTTRLTELTKSLAELDKQNSELSTLLSDKSKNAKERGALITRFNGVEEDTDRVLGEIEVVMGSIRNSLLKLNTNNSLAEKAVNNLGFVGKDKENETRAQLKEFFNVFGGKGFSNVKGVTPDDIYEPTNVFMKPKERAWANPEMGHIQLNGNSSVTFHEMGHFLEMQRPWLNQFAQQWRDARANREQISRGKVEMIGQIPSPNGQIPTYSLKSMVPNSSYQEDEIGVSGKFMNPYMGKIYESGATEVVSMAVEHFSSSRGMANLYVKHPELFQVILGVAAQK